MPHPTRPAVLTALITTLEAELSSIEAMARLASDEATSDETRSEGKYDTRSTEASYLARGQAERVAALRQALAEARSLPTDPAPPGSPAGVGRMVHLERDDGTERWVMLVPSGGGTSVRVAGTAVQVITPASPLGRALVGANEDDEVEVAAAGSSRSLTIIAVQ